jgi:hypothetical protein
MSAVIQPPCTTSECTPAGDSLDIQEHGGWTWFTTSLRGVSADALNRGLCQLARPALQFTTSDGDRWYLTIHGGPRGQVHFLHEFSYHSHSPDPAEDAEWQARLDALDEPIPIDPRLAFLEEERSIAPDRPKAPFDQVAKALEDLGTKIPEELRRSVADLS